MSTARTDVRREEHGGPSWRRRSIAHALHNRIWRYWRGMGLSLAAGVTAGLVLAVMITRAGVMATPRWWRPEGPAQPERAQIAVAVDNGAWTALTSARVMQPPPDRVGPLASEPWTVSVTGSDAGAWLTERLPAWIGVDFRNAEVQTTFSGGRVLIGVRTHGSAVAWASVRPRVDEAGRLWLPAERLWIGAVGVPPGELLSESGDSENLPPRLRAALKGRGADLLSVLSGSTPVSHSPTLRLPDGRQVRLLALEMEDDRLVLTLRTER